MVRASAVMHLATSWIRAAKYSPELLVFGSGCCWYSFLRLFAAFKVPLLGIPKSHFLLAARDVVHFILSEMDSDNETQDVGNSQLDAAAGDGDLARCQMLVGQWTKQLSPSPITAQHLAPALAAAVGCKHPQVAAYLLEQGAVISGNDMILALGQTEDAIAMFQTFQEHGWDINSKTDLGNIMLKLASFEA